INKAILEERLSPGSKLPPEKMLAEMLGVSRGPVREALGALRVAGVVEITRGNGTYISKKIPLAPMAPVLFALLLQEGSPVEAFELREMLEIGTLEIAINKFTDKNCQKMQQTIDELRVTYEKGITNAKLLAQHDVNFHYAFAEATHNPLIVELTRAFWKGFSFSIQRLMQSKKDVRGAIENHTAILQALRAKDINRAREAVKKAVGDWEITGIRSKNHSRKNK
ncbi:unnamed protein product, partial [marine sediment metagenome]